MFKQKKIMKKTYKNPVLEIIKIQTQQMLAQSVGYDPTEMTNPGDIDARGGDFTFDEDAFDFGTEESISSFE